MKINPILIFIIAFFLTSGHHGQAQFWGAKKALPFEKVIESLKPGQFIWEPEIATSALVESKSHKIF